MGWNPRLWLLFPAFFGWVGVPIFFTVSGFCIHLSHQRSKDPRFSTFFIRRFFRIYPPYLLALFLCAFVFIESHLEWGSGPAGRPLFASNMEQLISHIFLVHNLSQELTFGINPAFWSIAVEAQLYVIYPLLIWLAWRLGWRRALWFTAIIELGSRCIASLLSAFNPAWEIPGFYLNSPFYFWFTWTMGAVLAEAWLKGQPLPFRSSWGFLWPLLFVRVISSGRYSRFATHWPP